MRRHDLDVVSLVTGLLFLIVAAVHIGSVATDSDLDLQWMLPAVLLLIGVVGLLSAVRGPARPSPALEPASAPVVGPSADTSTGSAEDVAPTDDTVVVERDADGERPAEES